MATSNVIAFPSRVEQDPPSLQAAITARLRWEALDRQWEAALNAGRYQEAAALREISALARAEFMDLVGAVCREAVAKARGH